MARLLDEKAFGFSHTTIWTVRVDRLLRYRPALDAYKYSKYSYSKDKYNNFKWSKDNYINDKYSKYKYIKYKCSIYESRRRSEPT